MSEKELFVGDLIEKNGKTIKQNNLTIEHSIPFDTLVEVDIPYSEYHKMRMYVVSHERDCDGTPLYGLSYKGKRRTVMHEPYSLLHNCSIFSGFSDECLKIVEI